MNEPVDLEHLRQWIGADESAEDVLGGTLAERFAATLSLETNIGHGAAAPRLIHFCLCQPAAPMAGLGEDGHPARGGFLPPVPLPRRMWAASKISFDGDLKVGDTVRRRSVIADVVVKEGKTGTLCFVTVDHVFSVDGAVRVEDRQTIVYRSQQGPAPATAVDAAPRGELVASIDPTPTLLFRYSALTFNGHRIHYDAPYATGVEGYAGLVVHGPLQATMLLHLAARARGRQPDRFSFQSLSTLFDREPMILNAGALHEDKLALWTCRPDGPIAMRAEASWA